MLVNQVYQSLLIIKYTYDKLSGSYNCSADRKKSNKSNLGSMSDSNYKVVNSMHENKNSDCRITANTSIHPCCHINK